MDRQAELFIKSIKNMGYENILDFLECIYETDNSTDIKIAIGDIKRNLYPNKKQC